MKTQKYLKTLSEGSGHLNPNLNKKTDKHPDYTGFIKIEGVFIKLAAWVKDGKYGKFLTISGREFDEDEQNAERNEL
jgi:hypothetical protein